LEFILLAAMAASNLLAAYAYYGVILRRLQAGSKELTSRIFHGKLTEKTRRFRLAAVGFSAVSSIELIGWEAP
jgi:hypothetical protein